MNQKSSDEQNDAGLTELSDGELERARGGILPPGALASQTAPQECVLPPGRLVRPLPSTSTLRQLSRV